jgi:hypothetical protein
VASDIEVGTGTDVSALVSSSEEQHTKNIIESNRKQWMILFIIHLFLNEPIINNIFNAKLRTFIIINATHLVQKSTNFTEKQ